MSKTLRTVRPSAAERGPCTHRPSRSSTSAASATLGKALALAVAGVAFLPSSGALAADPPCKQPGSYTFSGPSIGISGLCVPGGGMSLAKYVSEKNSSNPDGWKGPVTFSWGTPGKNFKVNWDNDGVATPGKTSVPHQEFDLSIVRAYYSNFGGEQGYGKTRLSQFQGVGSNATVDATMTYNGGYTKTTTGNHHVQAILWLNKSQDSRTSFVNESGAPIASSDAYYSEANRWRRSAIDVTIADHYVHYASPTAAPDRVPDLGPKTLGNKGSVVQGQQLRDSLGSYTSPDGVGWKIYRRLPGDAGERASYIVIRNQDAPYGFNAIDPGPLLKRIIDIEAGRKQYRDRNGVAGPVLDGSWFLSQAGWEVAGQSGGTAGVNRNSKGEFTFACYSIPVLNGRFTDNGGRTVGGTDTCSSQPVAPAPAPSITVTNQGPIVRGTVANVEVGRTLVLDPPNTSGSADNVNVTVQSGGAFAYDLTSKPAFVNGGVVNMYITNKAGTAGTGRFTFRR